MKKGLHPYINKAYVLDSNSNLYALNTSTNTKLLKSLMPGKRESKIKKKSYNLWGKIKQNIQIEENENNKYKKKKKGKYLKALKRKKKLKLLLSKVNNI